jgi:phosphoribosylaminoimidazolecarboxamide formyltransferase/IMP cyclohydrolase
MKRTALISAYHKDGIADFAKALVARGWDILASGGTAKVLKDADVPVRDVGEIVGEPILGHRVVTLSRQIHAALLARPIPEDEEELKRIGVPRIDLVCVDLYPMRDVIDSPGATRESVIEMTDVGGPTLLHSASKGERFVISEPEDRAWFIEWLDGKIDMHETAVKDELASKAEGHVAAYCLNASRFRRPYLTEGTIGELVQPCKYGENAWQTPAGLYQYDTSDTLALKHFKRVEGSEPSYNNFADIDRLLQTVTHIAAAFDVNENKVPLIAVGVKHGNACGAAVGTDSAKVLTNMLSGDTRAIFGGLVMANFPIGKAEAEVLRTALMSEGQKRLLDGVIAPSFTEEAKEILARKEGKCRLIENPALAMLSKDSLDTTKRLRYVRGGFLMQPNYAYVFGFSAEGTEGGDGLSPDQKRDMLLAWAVGSTSNSNTVTLVKDGMLIGNGVGQQDRVGCCELAIKRATDAGHEVTGAAAYSDSFFPFPDGPETLAKASVAAILATRGSVKDAEIRAACENAGVALVTVPDALGRGFYNH